MVSQHAINLSLHLITSYFGDLVAKVCECLLRRGSLPLAQIMRFTELSKENVEKALLVLLQHNCVQAFAIQREGAFGEVPRVITQYMAIFDNIIHHLRFPKFLAIVLEELDKECGQIFEGLLQHGRLSMNQLMDRHKQTSTQSGGNSAMDALQESFKRLVDARFVERCPAPEPFLAPPSEEETPAKKRGAKSAKITEELMTIEQRALAAAAPMESIRFFVEIDISTDVSVRKSEEKSNLKVGEKRKKDSLDSDMEAFASNGKKEVLWRVNFEEFTKRLRHKACIANVRARFDDGVAVVLSAILEATRSVETKVKTEKSVALSVNTVFEEVMKSEEGRSRISTLESVRASLGQLGCELPIIEIDETYSIDLKKIIEIAQNDEVESIVLKRYGREAYRIFRLLSKVDRLLETDKISDETFVEKKDTAKILYKLWKDDYFHMEKVITYGARQSHFLLWEVNKQSLWKHVLDEMYHAALNLRLRITYEQEREKEILQIPREKLVGELDKRYTRLRKTRIVLESSLMKLDDALMLFHDF